MLEVINSKEEIRYPVARKARKFGHIIIFFSENYGVVLDPCQSGFKYGESSDDWLSCLSLEDWEPVDITITG